MLIEPDWPESLKALAVLRVSSGKNVYRQKERHWNLRLSL